MSDAPALRRPPAAPSLVLASGSPYRRALLERLGLAFAIDTPDVDETPLEGESPALTAQRLALVKAQTVARRHPDALVIGSDQTATIDGRTVLGKPGTHGRAVAQLRMLSGATTTFHTGLAVLRLADGFERVCVVDTQVRMRHLTDAMIENYLAREPAYDCAGSAKIEGLGIALVEALEGPDPSALIGLPLIALTEALSQAGCPVL